MAISDEDQPTTIAAFDRVLATIERSPVAGAITAAARADADANARRLLAASGGPSQALTLATVAYATDLLASVAVDLAADPEQARRLADSLEMAAGVPRVALGRELLRHPALARLSGGTAVEVQLGLLRAFTGAAAVSLWSASEGAEPRVIGCSGDLDPARPGAAAAAREALSGHAPERGGLVPCDGALGIRIDPSLGPPGVLVAQGEEAAAPGPGVLLVAAAPVLAGLLDRDSLVDGHEAERSLAAAVERRLARLRFDLHDGPQQDVHLFAQDLRLFRQQLGPILADDPDRDRALGRLDDLEAQLVALDGDLRSLSSSVQSPLLTPGSLGQALAELVAAFERRTGLRPTAEVAGELSRLTDSQQIAVLSLVREALSNIRRHSEAEHVSISVAADADGVSVRVTDDGVGFDPENTRESAARAGHLGLVGMHERVRMLGGRTEIDSRPGGPTVVTAILPPWSPPKP